MAAMYGGGRRRGRRGGNSALDHVARVKRKKQIARLKYRAKQEEQKRSNEVPAARETPCDLREEDPEDREEAEAPAGSPPPDREDPYDFDAFLEKEKEQKWNPRTRVPDSELDFEFVVRSPVISRGNMDSLGVYGALGSWGENSL